MQQSIGFYLTRKCLFFFKADFTALKQKKLVDFQDVADEPTQ